MAVYADDAPRRQRRHEDYDGFDSRQAGSPRYRDDRDPTRWRRRAARRAENYDASDEDDSHPPRRAQGASPPARPYHSHHTLAEEAPLPHPPIGEDRDGSGDPEDVRKAARKARDPLRVNRRSPSELEDKHRSAGGETMPMRQRARKDEAYDLDHDRYSDARHNTRNQARDDDRYFLDDHRRNGHNGAQDTKETHERSRDVDHEIPIRSHSDGLREERPRDPARPPPERFYRDDSDRSGTERRRQHDDIDRDKELLPPRRTRRPDPREDDSRLERASHRHGGESEYERPRRRDPVRSRRYHDDRDYLSDAPRRRDRGGVDSRGYRTDGRDSHRSSPRHRSDRDGDPRERRHRDDRDHDSQRDSYNRKRAPKKGDMDRLKENGQKTWHSIEPVAKPLLMAAAQKFLAANK